MAVDKNQCFLTDLSPSQVIEVPGSLKADDVSRQSKQWICCVFSSRHSVVSYTAVCPDLGSENLWTADRCLRTLCETKGKNAD